MLTEVEDRPAGAAPPRRARWADRFGRPTPTGVWNAAVVLGGVAVFAWLGWRRRWISDDGLIVLRTVRNLLAGNGPVFNEGERVEVNTSTLWTVVVAVAGWAGADLARAAVGAGLVFSAVGLGLGLDAARRLHVPDGGVLLVPLGAMVLLALPPVRDFATSGLETGLGTLWITGSWWLLVVVARDSRPHGARSAAVPWVATVVLGLGPLVRPDLAILSLLGLPLLVALVRPRWPRLLGLAAAAAALPVGYEVFRVGYYGLLVPNTALAKEASEARWDRGVLYLHDTVATYWVWVPLAVGFATLALLLLRRGWGDRWGTVAVALLGPLAGTLMALYVVRVGGDFMHGRMLLPALTAAVLPVLAVPLSRWTALPVAGVAVWAVVCFQDLRVPYDDQIAWPTGFVDERAFWSRLTAVDHPLTAEQFIASSDIVTAAPAAVAAAPGPSLLLLEVTPPTFRLVPHAMRPGVDHTTMIHLNLGLTGAALPLDVRVVDAVGLANPLASHATPLLGGRVGHEKDLPQAWFVVDEVAPGVPTPSDPADVAAARAALACPEVADVLASVRHPLTWDRFWSNARHAVERTGERWSRLPERAADCDG